MYNDFWMSYITDDVRVINGEKAFYVSLYDIVKIYIVYIWPIFITQNLVIIFHGQKPRKNEIMSHYFGLQTSIYWQPTFCLTVCHLIITCQ